MAWSCLPTRPRPGEGPFLFSSSGGMNPPCGNSPGCALRIDGAYRAAPPKAGSKEHAHAQNLLRSTVPAYIPPAKPPFAATVAAK